MLVPDRIACRFSGTVISFEGSRFRKMMSRSPKTAVRFARSNFEDSEYPIVRHHWSLVIGHWSLVIGAWSLVLGHWRLVIGPYSSRALVEP
jgi:hypothetical protein